MKITRSSKTKTPDVEIRLRLPKEFPWKLLRLMISDLDSFVLEGDTDSDVHAQEYRRLIDGLRKVARKQDVTELLQYVECLEPRSILEVFGTNPLKFWGLYQLGALLKKYPFKGVDTGRRAFETFGRMEMHCEMYNRENHKALLAMSESHPDFLGIIEEVQQDILKLLGPSPNINRVYDCAKHGPGTAVGLQSSAGEVTSYFKWSSLPYTVSHSAMPYAKACIEADPRWIGALMNRYREVNDIPQFAPIVMEEFWESVFEITNYCRYASVPKTAKTDRSIAIEPLLNVFLQLGLDRIIKSRLKHRWGYDLADQENNQDLALEGSIGDELVTLDLKGASETVTLKICELYLPDMWLNLLLDLRSPKIRVDNDNLKAEFPLHKMSAMGNGFTFALESLIFAALVRAAMRRTKTQGPTAVYGDDLIVPKAAADYLITLLNLSGFSLNTDKSFVSGPFRESCGKDYLGGHYVRPFFLKKHAATIMDIFYIHNSLVHAEQILPWPWQVSFPKTKAWLKSFIRAEHKELYGPITEDRDTHLFSEKRLSRDKFGDKTYLALQAKAKVYNHRTDFFFRKLMVNLSAAPMELNPWEDLRRNPSTGNAFDVTKRDRVRFVLTKRRAW